MTEVVIQPAALSADAKRNAFYTQCSIIGETKPYAMCLYLQDRMNDLSLAVLYRECQGAIKCGKCPAIAMREEEILKGQAIYFIERERSGVVRSSGVTWASSAPRRSTYQRGKYESDSVVSSAPAPYIVKPAAPRVPKVPVFDGNIYAASLNIAASRVPSATNRQPPSIKPAATVAIAPVPETPAPKLAVEPEPAPENETPLEMARRLRAGSFS